MKKFLFTPYLFYLGVGLLKVSGLVLVLSLLQTGGASLFAPVDVYMRGSAGDLIFFTPSQPAYLPSRAMFLL